jgi:hypothetical protein
VRSIRQAWFALGSGAFLSWISALLLTGDEQTIAVGAIAPPIFMIAGAVISLYLLLRQNPLNVFSPIGPLCAVVILYFGIGALGATLADDATKTYMRVMYDFSPQEVVAVHEIVGLGLTILCIAALWALRNRPAAELVVGEGLDVPAFGRSVLAFYVIGMFVSVTMAIPYAIGLIKAPPAAFTQLGRLLTFSVLLMGYGLAKGILSRRIYLPAYGVAVAILLGGALLALNKFEILLQCGAALGGFILAKPSRRTIVVAAISGAAFVAVLTPFILVARQIGELESSTSIGGRLNAGRTTLELGNEIIEGDNAPNIVLVRLQYVNTMAWARNEYLNGRPGSSLTKNVFWLFVPRVAWPSKPVLSNTGYEITSLMLDVDIKSSTGITIFGEAFWNGGFTGVVLISTAVGLILGALSILSFKALESLDVAKIIFVWTGMIIGFRIDGLFYVDYIGQSIILLLTYVLLRVFLDFINARRETTLVEATQ